MRVFIELLFEGIYTFSMYQAIVNDISVNSILGIMES
jgi:hypothetical protein